MCLVHHATSNRLARKDTDFSLAGALRDAHQCSPKKLHRRDNVIVLSLGSMTLLSTEIVPAPYFGFCVYCLRGVFFVRVRLEASWGYIYSSGSCC